MLIGMVTGVHLGALVLAAAAPFATGWRIGIGTVILLSLSHVLRRHAWQRGHGAVTGLEIGADGDYAIQRPDGMWVASRFVERYVSRWLVVIRLTSEDRFWPVSVVLVSDGLAADELRDLRTRLNFQSPPAH